MFARRGDQAVAPRSSRERSANATQLAYGKLHVQNIKKKKKKETRPGLI